MENKTEGVVSKTILTRTSPQQADETFSSSTSKAKTNPNRIPIAIVIASLVVGSSILLSDRSILNKDDLARTQAEKEESQVSILQQAVLPQEGVVLPVTWGNLGAQLTEVGAIDTDKFTSIYTQKNAFTDEYRNLLLGENAERIKITRENAGYYLNLFWALGLASKNPILDAGEMVDPQYGGAQRFASTGGWVIAKGDPMNHYSKHTFFNVTPEQQVLIDKISKGIYRPCCGNSVHFPDCNHGMAMLGLLELMASQGADEQDMWDAALAVNAYWFPDTYLTIASYMQNQGIAWKEVNPQEVLGYNFSSAPGFAKIAAQVTKPEQQGGGGGCSV